jgi:hypothetical protein
VKISIPKLILAAAVLAGAFCVAIPASRAYQIGNEKWCAVTDNAGDVMMWDCEFETVEDCQPAVIVGTRDFFSLNPSYRPPPQPPPQPQPQPSNPQR